MKKFILAVFCLLVAASANWNGNRWNDEKYKFTFEIPGAWQIDPATRRRAYANRGDGVTEFYVEVHPAKKKDAPEKRNAKELATDSMRGYDSWRYVAGRELTGGDRKGAQTAFSVMYSRSILQRATSRPVQVIAQEGYYIKGDNAYIVTMVTDSDTWESAKKDLMQTWNSFRVQ